MRTISRALVFGIFCLVWTSCERDETGAGEMHSAMALPEPWFNLAHPYDRYPEMQPGRPIIIAFGAHWCAGGQLTLRTLFSDRVKTSLKRNGYLCLIGDLTKSDPFLQEQLKRLGGQSVPATTIYNPKTKEWEFLPDVLTEATALEAIRRCSQ